MFVCECDSLFQNLDILFMSDGFVKLKEALEYIIANDKLSKGAAYDAVIERLYNMVPCDYKEQINFPAVHLSGTVAAQVDNMLENVFDVSRYWEFYVSFEPFVEYVFHGEESRYFTPKVISKFVADILAPSNLDRGVDICVGSGSMLCSLYEKYSATLLYGVDCSVRMYITSFLLFFFRGVKGVDLRCADSLESNVLLDDTKFDIVVGDFTMDSTVNKAIARSYQLGKSSARLDALMLERSLKLLRPGGRMGVVLREEVFTSEKYQFVREFVEKQARLCGIVSLPMELSTQYGNKYKLGIVFLKKNQEFFTKENYPVLVSSVKWSDKDNLNSISNLNETSDNLKQFLIREDLW